MSFLEISPPEQYKLGDRVYRKGMDRHETSFGTVAYSGPIEGQIGSWLGIIWDLKQGKYDGTYNGKRYFTCENGFGSFLKKEKVGFAISLSQAIQENYIFTDIAEEQKEQELILSSKQKSSKTIITLTGLGIETIDVANSVSLVPDVTSLDLSKNFIHNWKDILSLTKQMKSLTFLDLSHNMLLSNDSMINKETDLNKIMNEIYENAFQTKLETIVLNFCNISWTTISSIFPYFNSLKELHCCGNGIKLLENSSFKNGNSWTQHLNELQILSLSENDISDWNEIWKLSTLPKLETLYLNDNKIESLSYTKTEEIPFKNLQTLSLASNRLNNWNDIDILNNFPSLKAIRINHNPLTELPDDISWSALLGRTKQQIILINGSNVKQEERNDDVKYYLKLWLFEQQHLNTFSDDAPIAKSVKQIPTDSYLDKLKQENHEIVSSIEEQIKAIKSGTIETSASSNLLELKLSCYCKEITVKIPPSMRLSLLKRLIHQKLGIEMGKQKLLYFSPGSSFSSIIDRDESLEYHGIRTGGTISVQIDDN